MRIITIAVFNKHVLEIKQKLVLIILKPKGAPSVTRLQVYECHERIVERQATRANNTKGITLEVD